TSSGIAYIQVSASCASVDTLAAAGSYSFNATTCYNNGISTAPCVSGGCTAKRLDVPDLDLTVATLKAKLQCPIPPPDNCSEGESGSGGAGKMAAAGAAADTCKDCVRSVSPAGCSQGIFGHGPSCSPVGSGPGTSLRYYA